MIEKTFKYEKEFLLECGSSLARLEVRYHVSCESHEGKRIIWICHALTANSDAEDWWNVMVGPGKFFDTASDYVICANILGSCYGSTGPQSIDPRTGRKYLLEFPRITVRDFVNAHELLRESLGIDHIDVLIGASTGEFQAIEWAIMNPFLVRNLILMCGGPRITAWATAFNATQRMILEADPSFKAQQDARFGGKKALEACRALGLISYRSYAGYVATQSEPDPDCLFADKAGSYQRHQGEKLSSRFDAYSYFYLLWATDSHNVGRGRGGVEAALKVVKSKTLCISIDSDVLFPVSEMKNYAALIPHAQLAVIPSAFGHDGFLLEHESISKIICKFLNSEALQ